MSSPAMAPRPVVLVVDDEPMMRELMTQALAPHYQVLAAADGQQALDLVWGMGSEVRLVVTDIRMPRLDGLGLASQLRQLDRPPPVLFISGFANSDVPGPLLAKPFRPDALVEAVSRLLSRVNQVGVWV